jgi:protein O-GlcNAc transferase
MSKRPLQPPTQQSAVHPLLPQAVALHQAGRTAEAAKLYQQILVQVPRHFDATHLLGVIALQGERLDQAEHLITLALEINPNDAAALSNLGTVHLRGGQLEAACSDYEKAVKLQPNSFDALANLGTVLRQVGRYREALVPLRRAHSINPNSAMVCGLIGACLLVTGDTSAAVKFFELTTHLEPADAQGWVNLATALSSSGAHKRAQECSEKAIAIDPRSSAALDSLATAQFDTGQIETAIATYRKAVALEKPSSHAHSEFAKALYFSGRYDEAMNHYRQAIQIDGNDAVARWRYAMAQCRPFYGAAIEIEPSRHALSKCLKDLQTWFQSARHPEAYTAVGSSPPFYLAYQAFNNRDLLTRHGDLCAQWMASMPTDALTNSARLRTPGKSPAKSRKLRLGIASSHIRDHSVWLANIKGLVHHLDKSQFDIYLYKLGRSSDEETARAKRAAAHFEDQPKNLAEWVRAISEANLDALVYPEVGMEELTIQLASLRLAPVQAATWGHPETTGLPTIDLYLSADAFEPMGAQDHYREQLVRLPNLGIFVEPLAPTFELPHLRSLGLPSDEPLLLCPGTPFKYSPMHDNVWARIAKGLHQEKAGRLVFFRGRSEYVDRLLQPRLRRAFDRERVDFDARVCIIEALDRPNFFGLMQQSALMLDTLDFSGFNTVLQAAECGLPVLAYEGSFMRGRLGSGIMRRMGLPELVVSTGDAFIQMALQLAGDSARRDQLRIKIANQRNILFRDIEPVRALERCLVEAITQNRSVRLS